MEAKAELIYKTGKVISRVRTESYTIDIYCLESLYVEFRFNRELRKVDAISALPEEWMRPVADLSWTTSIQEMIEVRRKELCRAPSASIRARLVKDFQINKCYC